MDNPKILIAAPIGDGKEYSINEWFGWIARQPYKNYDVALCVNGKDKKSIKKKVEMLKQVEIEGRSINVLQLDYNEYHTTKHRLSYSRDILRKFALASDYDFILWLDTDTIPMILDALPLMLAQNKDVLSGLYFYKGTRQSVIIDEESKTNMTFERIQELVTSGEVVKVWGFGFGCLLMSKSVLSQFKFDYRYKFEDWSEDFIACELIEKAGFDRWFYARIICKHYHSKDFNIEGENSCSQQEPIDEGLERKDKHIPPSEDST